jgi:Transketolase, thiamine diphosphate binding domain
MRAAPSGSELSRPSSTSQTSTPRNRSLTIRPATGCRRTKLMIEKRARRIASSTSSARLTSQIGKRNTDLTFTEDRARHFEACGWHIQSVADGNDLVAASSLRAARIARRWPASRRSRLELSRPPGADALSQDQSQSDGHCLDGLCAVVRLAPHFLGDIWPARSETQSMRPLCSYSCKAKPPSCTFEGWLSP